MDNLSQLFKFVVLILFSWVIIHLVAVMGVFVAIAYPFLWLIAPNALPCWICRIKKTPACLFRHSVYNGLLVLLFSIISIGIVYGESQLFIKLTTPPTAKTVSFTIPLKGTYRLRETFPMKVEISGARTPINAIQADITFNPHKLEVVDISIDKSFANIFVQKDINNQIGYARLSGGLPNPGFLGQHGLFCTFYFKSKEPGVTKVDFLPSSLVLANDGKGTNVLKNLATTSFLILPEELDKQQQEDQHNAIVTTNVLGVSTDEGKVQLYTDNPTMEVPASERIDTKKQEQNFLIKSVNAIDDFILDRWAPFLPRSK